MGQICENLDAERKSNKQFGQQILSLQNSFREKDRQLEQA